MSSIKFNASFEPAPICRSIWVRIASLRRGDPGKLDLQERPGISRSKNPGVLFALDDPRLLCVRQFPASSCLLDPFCQPRWRYSLERAVSRDRDPMGSDRG